MGASGETWTSRPVVHLVAERDVLPVKVIYSRYADDWRLGSWHWPGEEKKGEGGKGGNGEKEASDIDELVAGLSAEDLAKIRERANVFSPSAGASNAANASSGSPEVRPDSGAEKDRDSDAEADQFVVAVKETIN